MPCHAMPCHALTADANANATVNATTKAARASTFLAAAQRDMGTLQGKLSSQDAVEEVDVPACTVDGCPTRSNNF
jgi:hypothetical protein